MAKGQVRGNKEAKKPKADKAKKVPATAGMAASTTPAKAGKKK